MSPITGLPTSPARDNSGALRLVSPQPPVRVLLAGHSRLADIGVAFPDYGGLHKLASHLQPSRLNSLAQGGAMLCVPEGVSVAAITRYGGFARFLSEVLGNAKSPPSAPYVAGQQFTVLGWGANDMAFMGPATFQTSFPHALRSVIARARSASIFEETDASIAYTGTWSNLGLAGISSGGAVKQTAVQGDSFTITVPADFEGGTIDLGFITAADGRGALFTITGTGCAAGVNTTHDSRNINGFNNGSTRVATGQIMCSVKRLTGLAAGAGTITVTVTTINTLAFFDYWAIESNDPGPVTVIEDFYFVDYSLYSAGYPYGAAQGYSDADIDTVNNVVRGVVAEFADPKVYSVNVNDLFTKQAKYYAADKAHLNELGQGLLAERLISSFNQQGFATLVITKPVTSDRRYYQLVGAGGPAFLNAWVNSGNAGEPLTGCYKHWESGLVSVKGSVKTGSAATAVVFQLPIGYRPRENVYFAVNGNGALGLGKIDPAGNVSFIAGGSTVVTTFTVTFLAEQ